MFDAFFEGLAWLLNFYYELVPDYGLAIVLLTLTVMVVVTPFTLKGTRSMIQMQTLQPELRRIQKRYKDDRQKMNEEMMKFYQENNINPLGGCLPLVIQMPIFLVLYQVINGITRINGETGNFDPKYLDHSQELYRSLSGTNEMKAFGLDLGESASKAFGDGIVHGMPYLVLIALVAASTFYQQRQIAGRNPQLNTGPQAMIMKILPAFFAVISFGFPAALVVYFLTSNLYRVGQQAYITRSLYGHDEALGKKAQRAAEEARLEREREKKEKPDASNGRSGGRAGGAAGRAGGKATPAGNGGTKKAAPSGGGSSHPRSKKKKKRR